MQPHTVATIRIPYVDHGLDVVGNGEVDGAFHQPEEGFFEVR